MVADGGWPPAANFTLITSGIAKKAAEVAQKKEQ